MILASPHLTLHLDMDTNVCEVIQKLKQCRHDGKFSPETDKYLLVLNYLLPDVFLKALDLIESKACHKYTCGPKSLRVINTYIVNSAIWGCTCSDFTRAMAIRHSPICEHLIASYLLDELPWWSEPVKQLDKEEFALI